MGAGTYFNEFGMIIYSLFLKLVISYLFLGGHFTRKSQGINQNQKLKKLCRYVKSDTLEHVETCTKQLFFIVKVIICNLICTNTEISRFSYESSQMNMKKGAVALTVGKELPRASMCSVAILLEGLHHFRNSISERKLQQTTSMFLKNKIT